MKLGINDIKARPLLKLVTKGTSLARKSFSPTWWTNCISD